MIKLNSELCIQTLDERCVAVQKKQIKKNGEESWINISYHNSVVSALRSIRKKKLLKCIDDNEMTLSEAIEAIEKTDKEFTNEIKSFLECRDHKGN